MPDTPDEIDPFQDKGEAGEEPLQTFRLKVGMTFAAGVLSIVATTAVLIVLNRDVERVNKPVGIDVVLPVPSVMPEPSATASSTAATPTATVSQTPRPSNVTGPPGAGPTKIPEATNTPVVVTLQSLSCPASVPGGQNVTCEVTLSAPAQTDMPVSLMSSDSTMLSIPNTVTVLAGSTSASVDASSTAPSGVDPVTVTVTATMGSQSRDDTISVEPPPAL